jgi:putative tricarboxylic transport membrane protein
MGEIRRELRSGIFFLGLSLFVLWESLRVGLGTLKEPGSGFLSLCGGIALAGFSIVLIVRGGGLRESLRGHSGRIIFAIISLFVYSLVMEFIGFYLATFSLVAILLQIGQRRRWGILLGMSAMLTFLAYLVFGVLLRVYFPIGFLGI